MRTLAIETATEACSVALFDGYKLVAHDYRVLGRGHAEQLVPMIADLPDRGRADRILVSLGPGSFTGVRIGIAAARALGFAWDVEILGYPTLALMAAMAQAEYPAQPVAVCMNGGHGEWFVQVFDREAAASSEVLSLCPAEAAGFVRSGLVAGNRAKEMAELLSGCSQVLDFLPDAKSVKLLAENWFTPELSPIYGRGPDARLPS